MKDVAGKIAFVTGAASGIGLGMARALASAGAKVALCDIDINRAQRLVTELTSGGASCVAVPLDVTDEASWAQARETVEATLGEVSILCNNAGVGGGSGLAESYAPRVFRWVFRSNIDSILYGIRCFVPGMRARGVEGHVVNVSSMAGVLAPPNSVAYVASKFAVTGFTLALRNELKSTSIRTSVLCPGMTATRIVETTARLRPGERAQGVSAQTAAAMNAILSTGMNPDSVGRAVLAAILCERFYIFTHPEWKPLAEARVADLLEGFGPSAQPGYADDIAAILNGLSQTRDARC